MTAVGLGAIGGIASLAAAILVVAALGEWGSPGSAAYERYEAANRWFGLAIAASAAGPLALRLATPGGPATGPLRRLLAGAAIALVVMAIGSFAEFWLFSDQPYASAAGIGRTLAWTLFLVAGIVLLVLTPVIGLLLWRGATTPRWLGAFVALAVPIGVAWTIAGASFLIVLPIATASMAGAAIATARASRPASAGPWR